MVEKSLFDFLPHPEEIRLSMKFTAYPHDTYRPYKRRKRESPDVWVAPERFDYE